MTDNTIQNVRKVWLPSTMKAAVQEYCWRHRMRPSTFLVQIVQEIVDFPERYEDTDVPPAGLDYFSVRFNPDTWDKGVAIAGSLGTRLSAMIRVGIARELATEDIPWDVTTPRPRNEHIPIRE